MNKIIIAIILMLSIQGCRGENKLVRLTCFDSTNNPSGEVYFSEIVWRNYSIYQGWTHHKRYGEKLDGTAFAVTVYGVSQVCVITQYKGAENDTTN